MNSDKRPAPAADRWVNAAVTFSLLGLLGVLFYLWQGFGPWTMGIGFFVGAPLLALSLIFYLIAVIQDLRRRRVL
jgi:hypothetical protein